MTKEDHATVRLYRDRVRQQIEAGQEPTEALGKSVARQMAAEGTPVPAEVAAVAGWAA